MSTKKILIKALLIAACFIITNEMVYSQPGSSWKETTYPGDMSEMIDSTRRTMTCEDLKNYIENHGVQCEIDYSLCEGCLNVEGEIAFDTTQSTVDNLSPGCLKFFTQVGECLSKIKNNESDKYYNYLLQLSQSATLKDDALREFKIYESKGLIEFIRYRPILELNEILQIKINKSLLRRLENCK